MTISKEFQPLFIMKNLTTLFVLALVFVFSACTKEELLLPETTLIESPNIDALESTMPPAQIPAEADDIEYSVVNQLQVSKVSFSETAGELEVSFTGNYDFSSFILETDQNLRFTDTNGTESILAFVVNSSTASSGSLSVNFDLGTNNLSGLQLSLIQYIIIQDTVID